jgi:hypothetical protein
MPEFGMKIEKERDEAEQEALLLKRGFEGPIDTNSERYLQISLKTTDWMIKNKNEL